MKKIRQLRQYKEGAMIGKFRPQIFLAIIVLGTLAALGLYYETAEVATATIGGIIALGMKLMEAE